MMSDTNQLLSGGIAIVILAVVLVIGGMLLTQTYLASVATTGASGPIYALSTCIQYAANDTTSCTNQTNGSYTTTAWTRVDDPEASFDNDSNTYSTDLCEWGTQNFTSTYKIASNTTVAYWVVKYTLESATHTTNYTLSTPRCSQTGGNYVLYAVSSTEANESCDVSFGCRNATGITWFNHAP